MASFSEFRKSGHWPSLLASFLYFDISFMIWVLLGAVSVFVAGDLGLTPAQKGLMVAIPILGGSFFRIILGVLTDRIGPKKTAVIGMILTMLPLFLLWVSGRTLTELYAYGFLLGIAGASFAVALPLASRWYPPEQQGLVMGIAGAGNSGTLLATLFAPRIAEAFGSWHVVFGLMMIPMAVVLLIFLLIAKEPPDQPPAKKWVDYLAVLKQRDAWLFCFFYSVTFGGFVGMASFLPIFFNEQYGLNAVTAGNFVTLCVLAGSFIRPVGGWVADKVGGVRMLQVLFLIISSLFLVISFLLPFFLQMVVLFLVMAALGMGNGAVFQLVPQRFGKEIGVMTGIVGAAGGVGGFFLPSLIGALKGTTGTFASGYLLIAGIAAAAFVTMWVIGREWKSQMAVGQSVPRGAVRHG
ncbi:nitrate/nitrite transporter [Desmospora profundinema]|uniref:NNP family nitrate/nitrite transporter-like MFS transporter n=1 Tax=Desmospora profundinema TaxID=1571184 RepID=A0ABU1ING4_9BACL|nr:nitrate/nitrite transporter [Desmospora profundinema]MDR6226307.1 NNP family nitrate/nitrite transporter-like MFS transporter [Desmospora profundinema]